MTVSMQTFATREEWKINRINGIGGSEISAVVGLNPYMSNVELWELKTGRKQAEDISDKPYVRYGTQAEMHLRGLFRLDYPQYKVEYVDNNSFTNSKYPWARASLDGWMTDQDGRKGVLEIKTAEINSAQQREKWNNQIPQAYFCQVLMYMAILEAEFAILRCKMRSTYGDEIVHQIKDYRINRNEVEEDLNFLMTKGAEFWEYVRTDRRPPLQLPG